MASLARSILLLVIQNIYSNKTVAYLQKMFFITF
nr:MAG TPA: hypothetical protein [Caudoviricetes sp.]